MCAVTRRDPELRQKIIDATRQLIIKNGVNKTSLADVAKAVNISKGTLFYYYASKSDLIFDVTDQHFRQTTQYLTDWVNQMHGEMDANEILNFVFHSIVGDELRGRLHHYLIEQAVSESDSLKERFLEKYQEWFQLMSTGLCKIYPTTADHDLLAFIITACLDGLVIQSILGEKDIPIEMVTAYLSKTA